MQLTAQLTDLNVSYLPQHKLKIAVARQLFCSLLAATGIEESAYAMISMDMCVANFLSAHACYQA